MRFPGVFGRKLQRTPLCGDIEAVPDVGGRAARAEEVWRHLYILRSIAMGRFSRLNHLRIQLSRCLIRPNHAALVWIHLA